MRRKLITTVKSLLGAAACLFGSHAIAQTPVYHAAVHVDTPIGVGSIPNSAMLDYDPLCPTGPGHCGTALLRAVCYSGYAGSAPGFSIADGYNSPVVTSLPAGCHDLDIAVGNDAVSSTYYVAAVIYIDPSGNVGLNTYKINHPGALGALTVSPISSYHLTTGTHDARVPHIDIIADYATLVGGFPFCNKFAATWSDLYPSSPTLGINVYAATLASPGSGPDIVVPGPGYGYSDVAGIRRKVGGVVHDLALMTYIGAAQLYYQEWDITTNTFSSPILLDVNSDKYPRIDAIDDYNINNGSLANWVVTDDYSAGATQVIKEYNNLVPSGMDISSYLLAGTMLYTPAVSEGPGNYYTIAYSVQNGHNDQFVQDLDWTTGKPYGYPASIDYYQLNNTPIVTSMSLYQSVSTSPSCNNNKYIINAWANGGHILEKTASMPYNFKTTSVGNTASNDLWKLYPNPATNVITLAAPDNITNADYIIYDITGKSLLRGTITGNQQQIDIGVLPAGNYLMHINAGTRLTVVKFTKQ